MTFSCPFNVHSDQCGNFESDLFQAFCKVLETIKTSLTPYHASGNGQVDVITELFCKWLGHNMSPEV